MASFSPGKTVGMGAFGSAPPTQLSLLASGTVGAGQEIGGGGTQLVPDESGILGTSQARSSVPPSTESPQAVNPSANNAMANSFSIFDLFNIFVLLQRLILFEHPVSAQKFNRP